MAIADFNRNNPFVIMCRIKLNELNSEMIKATKNQIIAGVTSFVTLATSLILFPISGFYFYGILALFITIEFVLSLMLYKNILKHSVYNEMNSVIYGDEYKLINVDNERLLDLLLNLNKTFGKIEYHIVLTSHLKFFNLGIIFFLIIYFIINL